MNFIRHQNNVFQRMDANSRIRSTHISLYLALFRMWNRNRFINPVIISRREIMNMSKIGSPNTYIRVLKDLQRFGFILYHPSFDPVKGSKVELISFDQKLDEVSTQDIDQQQNKFTPPELNHVIIYFQQKGFEKNEAERFFNYYQSNGWMIGGRAKMKDWKAAARNWILNIPNFQTSSKPKKNDAFDKSFSGKKYNEQL